MTLVLWFTTLLLANALCLRIGFGVRTPSSAFNHLLPLLLSAIAVSSAAAALVPAKTNYRRLWQTIPLPIVLVVLAGVSLITPYLPAFVFRPWQSVALPLVGALLVGLPVAARLGRESRPGRAIHRLLRAVALLHAAAFCTCLLLLVCWTPFVLGGNDPTFEVRDRIAHGHADYVAVRVNRERMEVWRQQAIVPGLLHSWSRVHAPERAWDAKLALAGDQLQVTFDTGGSGPHSALVDLR